MTRNKGGRREFCPLFCILASLILTGIRLVLRLDFMDQGTGFYNTDGVISTVFNVSYFLFCAILALLVEAGYREQKAPPPLGKPGGIAAAMLCAATLFQTVWDGWVFHTAALRAADVMLDWATLVSALTSGAVLLVLAAELWSGRPPRSAASGALAFLVLHRCCLLISAFTRHTTSIAVSEDVLETLLLVFGILFFVAHARVLSGRQQRSGLGLLLFSGGAYVLTWSAFFLPDALGALMGRVPFPPSQAGASVQGCATAVYCFLVLVGAAGKARSPGH